MFNGLLASCLADIEITPEQLQSLAADLAAGYGAYAESTGAPDPAVVGETFIAYMQTEEAQQYLAEGLADSVGHGGAGTAACRCDGRLYGPGCGLSYGNAISGALETQITSAMQQVMGRLASGLSDAFGQAMTQIGDVLADAVNIDADAFAEAFEMNMTGEEFTELMMSMSSGQSASYDNNLRTLGYVDFDEPSGIDIYPKDFESKEAVVGILDDYNSRMEADGEEEKVITYTDMVGTLMSSVTTIIDIISYVLIAFVAISLIVSSIMIGVITYISVLERRKEIGILRAIGASKRNISQVFNAETFIIGLCAGVLGILISLLLLIPGNALIHFLAGTNEVSAVLPAVPAVVLIVLSVVLTLLGGLIPSKKSGEERSGDSAAYRIGDRSIERTDSAETVETAWHRSCSHQCGHSGGRFTCVLLSEKHSRGRADRPDEERCGPVQGPISCGRWTRDLQTLDTLGSLLQYKDAESLIRRFGQTKGHNDFEQISFYGSSGTEAAAALPDESVRTVIEEAWKGNSGVYTYIYWKGPGEICSPVRVPVCPEGAVEGVLTASVSTDVFLNILQDDTILGRTGYVHLISDSGKVLVRSSNRIVSEDLDTIYDNGYILPKRRRR